MKNNGLRNRFSDRVRLAWIYWYSCLLCHFNQPEILHHIISPSSHLYIDGEHNESVFNSCPLHNYLHPNARELKEKGCDGFGVTQSCHIGNEAHLYKDEIIKSLLMRVRDIIVDDIEFEIDDNDRKFLSVYANLYQN